MHFKSSKGPIILGAAMIFIVIVAVVIAIVNPAKDSTEQVASNQDQQDTSASTSTPSGTATSTELTYMSYTNSQVGYSIKYPENFTKKLDQEFPPNPGTTTKATVFTIPENMYSAGTIREASIAIATTTVSCDVWSDGTNYAQTLATTTVNGKQFVERVLQDAAAGSFYTTYEYSTSYTSQNNSTGCLRVALFIHGANPGMTETSEAAMNAKIATNQKIISDLETILGKMVKTVEFSH